jgi:hypothetical protein
MSGRKQVPWLPPLARSPWQHDTSANLLEMDELDLLAGGRWWLAQATALR